MNPVKNNTLTYNAKLLRKDMTKEERHLWYDFLKQQPENFNRQKVFGPYILDFYCAQKKLVIELDGSQHYAVSGQQSDTLRTAYLQEHGLTVLRYTNLEIQKNFQGVCTDILNHLHTSHHLTTAPLISHLR